MNTMVSNSKDIRGIALGIATFESLAGGSSKFVDKSLFIRDFWESGAQTILTTYPRRSGKSMNLQMLRTFLRIEVDEKGNPLPREKRRLTKYFVGGKIKPEHGKEKVIPPLKISEDAEMMSEQGECPVVYIDMKDCCKSSFDAILIAVKKSLCETFEDHKYLLQSNKISPKDKKLLEKYITSCKRLTEDEVHTSIKFLTKMLYEHFGKRAILLVDEYDAPINTAYMDLSDEEFKKVIKLYREIYGSVLKSNEYLGKALITGVMRLAKANLFSGLNNIREYNITQTNFAAHYGFTKQEVDMLVDYYSIPDFISQGMKDWYNGYKVGKYEIYNPWSVVQCINEYLDLKHDSTYAERPDLLKKEILRNYWEESGNIEFVVNLFKWNIVRRNIEQLVAGKPIMFSFRSSISSGDFKVLKEITQLGSNYEITQEASDVLFSCLTMGGYLTFADEDRRYFRLPNHEITSEFQARLLQYYIRAHNIPTVVFTQTTDQLSDLISKVRDREYSKHLQLFAEAFTSMLKELPEFRNIKGMKKKDLGPNRVVHGNEDIVHCMMSYIALQLHYITAFGTEISLEKGRADIAFIAKKYGVGCVIELKYAEKATECKKAAEDGLRQIREKEYSKQLCKHYDVLLLGVGISQDKKVVVCDKKILLQDGPPTSKYLPSLLEYNLL